MPQYYWKNKQKHDIALRQLGAKLVEDKIGK